MGFKAINLLIQLLLVYNHWLLPSLAADDTPTWTSLADKRVAAGFISIDCGMTRNGRYDNDTGLYYNSDIEFISTGVNKEVDSNYSFNDGRRIYNTLRYFPDGNRNCYTLRPLQGKNGNYLIRASFHYGNYDGLNHIPQFDLYIGVHFWGTVEPDSVTYYEFFELIYNPPEDSIYVCLVKTGSTIPFISALELKPLNNSIYKSSLGALMMRRRSNTNPNTNGFYTSVADDPYDRQWVGINTSLITWGTLKTDGSMNFASNDPFELPPSVLKIAAIPVPSSAPLAYEWSMGSYNVGLVCVYWHFAEIEKIKTNETREFTIFMPGYNYSEVISPKYLQPLTVISPPIKLINGSTIEFFIVKTNKSTLPPILNAFEIYEVVDLLASATCENDVNAMMNIKRKYTVPVSWQGDPCLPYGPWNGLKCNINDHNSPRITSLNLSYSGLTGDIPHSLSTLTALTYLDLSCNNLTGVIPDFLAKMPSLHTIDLRSNFLTGLVPVALSKKAKDGSITLRLEGNPYLCMSNPCKKNNSKKMVVILSTTSSLTFIVIAIVIMISVFNKKKAAKYIKNASSKLESRGFTFFEVMNMTNNFQTIIGKGGSGSVYHGSLQDGTSVAIKMLNPSSNLSLKLFRTEADLLTRVHHRNLVSLIGYCEEGTNMALIYEHIANGNLQQHILEKNVKDEKNCKVLCWKERLQIAVDAAQGLEYMHNGCKPPIVHRDMKTSNILLDENLHAKISDFGISKSFCIESSERGMSTNVVGTHGYVDPEYYKTRRLNKKSDVFSFGVVLLELITGKSPVLNDNSESIHIITWTTPKLESGDIENIVDKRLEGHFSTNSAWKALELAMMCVSSTAIRRPSMSQVLIDLNDCLAIEMSQGINREMDNYGYSYPSADIVITDTSIEMGPSAR